MTVHLCRDLFLGSGSIVGTTTGALHSMHALATFLQGVLGYTFHSSAGNLVPATGSSFTFNYYEYLGGSSYSLISQSTWPYRSASIHIGMGTGKENWVKLPTDMVNLMSAAFPLSYSGGTPWPNQLDPLTNKWLVVKSDEYPLANSGIFLITSVSLPDNALVIDYRSTTTPFPQTSSYVSASLWSQPPTGNEVAMAIMAGNGSATTYTTSGSATWPRMILTSPSVDRWQLRLCVENQVDRNDNGSLDAALTAMPGYSGSNGDFRPRSHRAHDPVRHLHAGQWLNLQVGVATIAGAKSYSGLAPGLDAFRAGGSRRQRMFIWGDDVTGTTYACVRGHTATTDCFVAFGEPESPEPVPHPINKLFVLGSGRANSGIDWRAGPYHENLITGLAFSLDPKKGPVSCNVSPWLYIGQSNLSASIHHDPAAGDSPFLSASELMSVDLMAGMWPQLNNTQPSTHAQILNIEPRRMGLFPFARLGRCRGTNATGSWYAVEPNRDWYHIMCGVYLPWGGVASLP